MKKTIYILLTAISCVALTAGIVSCSNDAGEASMPGGENGQGGSMARFAIMGDYMYVVDHSTLKTISLANPAHPNHLQYKDERPAGWNTADIETIFPDSERNLLFIGSQSAMYIYDASNPEFLKQRGRASHITSCDPVVSAGDYAYVTLNTENWRCNIGNNLLNIYDIRYLGYQDYGTPELMNSIPLASPKGLGIDSSRDRLFVCAYGLLMYDITNPVNPVIIDDLQNSVGKVMPDIIDSYDVIPMTDKGYLLLVGRDGLFQLNYGTGKFELLDYIAVNREE